MKCEKCPADSALGCTAGVKPYQLRSGDTGCAWNLRIIKKHMNQSKPITNADRIRSMSDEQLAEWLCDIAGWLPEYEGRMHPILEWLKEEATE